MHGMNRWPVQRPDFDASLRQYIHSCLGVGQAIMRGIIFPTTGPLSGINRQPHPSYRAS